MRSPFKTQTDSGAVTAEFAVTLPVVIASVLFSVSAITAAATQLQMQQLSVLAIRALSQGQTVGALRGRLKVIEPLAALETDLSEGVLCAFISKRPQGALKLLGYEPKAKACTWVGKYFEPS